MIPITRIERYLAYIAQDQDANGIDDPITREEFYLAKIAGQEVVLPDKPVTRIEMYLSKIAGEETVVPSAPITREEMYLAAIAGEDVSVPTPQTRLEYFLNEWLESTSHLIARITGELPLSLNGAANGNVVSLIQKGKTARTESPSSDTHPVTILCNNGALAANGETDPSVSREVITLTRPDQSTQSVYVADLHGISDDYYTEFVEYLDEQDVISGVITRRVGKYVFTGDENISLSYDDPYHNVFSFFVENCASDSSYNRGGASICSYYSTLRTPYISEGRIFVDTSPQNAGEVRWCDWDKRTFSVEDMKQIMKTLYENGTPIVLLYPLAVPVVERVDPQLIQTKQGDNVISAVSYVDFGKVECEYVIESTGSNSPVVGVGLAGYMTI